jgi:hypothetical protein
MKQTDVAPDFELPDGILSDADDSASARKRRSPPCGPADAVA